MDSPPIITEPTPPQRRVRALAVACLVVLLPAGRAAAHNVPTHAVREMVRIQGHLGSATPPAGGRQVTFLALGQRLAFSANEWRVFAFADEETAPRPEPTEPTLVGDRALLRRVTTARPEQRLTILAERRPGSADLFVLAVDRCPE